MVLFEVVNKLGRRVRISEEHWNYIVNVKHPSLKGLEEAVKRALIEPTEIRKSRRSRRLFVLRSLGKLICVIAKHLNEEGYILTAYLTRRAAPGELVWRS